jgi:uncharacterized protein
MSQSQELIRKVTVYVEKYMNNFDGSHDFNHIKRVLGQSRQIIAEIENTRPVESETTHTNPKLDPTVVTLAALLHDVGDRKYLKEGEDGNTMVRDLLLSFGADEQLAEKVQIICLGVAYSSEIKDRGYVERLIRKVGVLRAVFSPSRLFRGCETWLTSSSLSHEFKDL